MYNGVSTLVNATTAIVLERETERERNTANKGRAMKRRRTRMRTRNTDIKRARERDADEEGDQQEMPIVPSVLTVAERPFLSVISFSLA